VGWKQKSIIYINITIKLSENQCGMETNVYGFILRTVFMLSENQCGMETGVVLLDEAHVWFC
jgi:hypothetical protein